jgi:hypothetical protein
MILAGGIYPATFNSILELNVPFTTQKIYLMIKSLLMENRNTSYQKIA